MPIDPVKIPQNVYIEDRIVGPLTLRQIIIVGIGGGISYGLWAMAAKAYGSVSILLTVLVWLPAVISLAFAFLKINDLSLVRLLLLLMEKTNKPGLRTWGPRTGLSVNIRTFHSVETEQKKMAQNEKPVEKTQQKLHELSSILDNSLDTAEAPAFTDAVPAEDMTNANMVTETSSLPPKPVDPARISVSQNDDGAPLDGVAPRARSSLFSSIPSR